MLCVYYVIQAGHYQSHNTVYGMVYYIVLCMVYYIIIYTGITSIITVFTVRTGHLASESTTNSLYRHYIIWKVVMCV